MEIQGKTTLVTGSAKRLGKAIALEMARQGANVVVHYRKSKAEAEETAVQITEIGVKSIVLSADLRDCDQIQSLVDQATAALGPIDILINSASLFLRTPFGSVIPEQWNELLESNLRGPFFLAQAVAPGMKRKGTGKIINFGDATTPYAVPDFMPYAISKAGIEAMTRGLARALAPEIQVNAILPGAILPSAEGGEKGWEVAVRANLLKRPGTTEDITNAVIYFITQGDFLTGVSLPVDGGRALGR